MSSRTPYFQVILEDQDVSAWVDSVSVVEDDRMADGVSIAISDPRMIYADALFEGSLVEVDMGYAEANQHALMLRAVITKVDVSYPANGVSAVTLKGEDQSILMGLVEKNRLWRNLSVTDIVREIADEYDFLAGVEARLDPDPPVARRPIHQDGKTDLGFLQDLAKEYHAKCFVELDEGGDEILYFMPERSVTSLRRPDEIVLRYRMGPDSNLVSFSPSFDSNYIDRLKEVNDVDVEGEAIESAEAPPVEVVIWGLSQDRLAEASPKDRDTIRALYDVGASRKRELQEMFASQRPTVGEVAADQADLDATVDSLEALRLGMSANGSTFGNVWLRAKSRVEIQGVGERFNGDWYVTSATHKIDRSGFKSDFKCVR